MNQFELRTDRIEEHFDQAGFGLWAVEVPASTSFIGFVGLWPATFDAHFTPAVEVGWRLAPQFWGFLDHLASAL